MRPPGPKDDVRKQMLVFLVGLFAAWAEAVVRPITSTPPVPRIAVSWGPFQPKYHKPIPGMAYSHAFVEAPQDYFGDVPGAAGRAITLRIRRYAVGDSPKRHLWVIPGGPGQHSNDVERLIGHIAGALPRDTWIYAMDHRGTGQSGKIMSSKRATECRANRRRCYEAAKYPMKIMNPQNAAMDYIAVSKSINGGKDWYAFGSSYGGLLVDYIYRLDPDVFRGICSNSMVPTLRAALQNPYDITANLKATCDRSEKCRAAFVGGLDSVFSRFLSASNECTAALRGVLEQLVGRSGSRPLTQEEVLNGLKRGALMINNLALYQVPLILNAAVQCRSRMTAARKLRSLAFSAMTVADRSHRLPSGYQWPLNEYMILSETVDNMPATCPVPSVSAFCPQCSHLLWTEANFGNSVDSLRPYLYAPAYPEADVASPTCRYIMSSSILDTNTLHDSAKAHFDARVRAADRHFISIPRISHGGVVASTCFPQVMSFLFGLVDKDTVTRCIQQETIENEYWALPEMRPFYEKPAHWWAIGVLALAVALAPSLTHAGLLYFKS